MIYWDTPQGKWMLITIWRKMSFLGYTSVKINVNYSPWLSNSGNIRIVYLFGPLRPVWQQVLSNSDLKLFWNLVPEDLAGRPIPSMVNHIFSLLWWPDLGFFYDGEEQAPESMLCCGTWVHRMILFCYTLFTIYPYIFLFFTPIFLGAFPKRTVEVQLPSQRIFPSGCFPWPRRKNQIDLPGNGWA